MEKLKSYIKKKIFRIEQEKVLCFTISNYGRVYKKNPEALEQVERALANIGALPAKIDLPTKIFCVTLANPTIKGSEVLKIFRKYGFKAKIKKKGKGVFKYSKTIKILPKNKNIK